MPPNRRIVQFKMPITTTKLSKNDLERLYQARAPPALSQRPQAKAGHEGLSYQTSRLLINRGRTRFALARGFERTCNRTRPLAIRSAIFYRSTNQQSVALLSTSPPPFFGKRRQEGHATSSRFAGQLALTVFLSGPSRLPSAESDFIASRAAIKAQKLFYARCSRWFARQKAFIGKSVRPYSINLGD